MTAAPEVKSITQRRAAAELTLAGGLWGFSFIAQRFTLESWSPFAALAIRCLGAFLISLPLLLINPSLRRLRHREEFFLALVPGLVLGATISFQNAGLRHTSVANCSFITTLYVLFVPLIDALIFRRAVPRHHGKVILIALGGMALLCRFHEARFNIGDLLTLACSFLGALQIAWIGKIAPRVQSPLAFNSYQAFWSGSFALVGALVTEGWHWHGGSARSWLGSLYLSIGSTLIAFMIQIRAQRVLSSSTASILFLLEAPFATFFGYLVLHETLDATQSLGAALILGACYLAILLETRRNRRAKARASE